MSVERPAVSSMSQSDGLLMNSSTSRVSPAHGGRQTLFLCEDYTAPAAMSTASSAGAAAADEVAESGRACPRGDECPDVHADLTNTREYYPHAVANMSEDAVAAMRHLPASLGDLEVAQPNTKDELHLLAASECLETRALECERRPLSHCAHFRTKQLCNYGYACEFIHHLPSAAEAVFAHASLPLETEAGDTSSPPPRARRSTLAPPASGEPTAAAVAGSSRPDAMALGLGASASPLGLPMTAAMPQVCDAADDDDDNGHDGGDSPRNGADGGSRHAAERNGQNTAGGGGVGGMSLSTSRAGASGARFRHDPYGAKGWVSVSNSFAEGE